MFESFKTGNLAGYYKKILVIFLVTTIFIAAAFYVYITYIKKRAPAITGGPSQSSVSSQPGGAKSCDLYFFYADWCPHCKKAKPEWQNLKSMYSGGKQINGYTINFVDVSDKNKEIVDKFNVEGFPTIKLIKGNQIIEFDAKPDVKTMDQFLNTVLNN